MTMIAILALTCAKPADVSTVHLTELCWPQQVIASSDKFSIAITSTGKPYYWSHDYYEDEEYLRPLEMSKPAQMKVDEPIVSVSTSEDIVILTTLGGKVLQTEYNDKQNKFEKCLEIEGINDALYAIAPPMQERWSDSAKGYAFTKTGKIFSWEVEINNPAAQEVKLESKAILLSGGCAVLENDEIINLSDYTRLQAPEKVNTIIQRESILMLSDNGGFYVLDFDAGNAVKVSNSLGFRQISEYTDSYNSDIAIRADGQIIDYKGELQYSEIQRAVYLNGGEIITAEGLIYQTMDTIGFAEDVGYYKVKRECRQVSIPEEVPVNYLIRDLPRKMDYTGNSSDMFDFIFIGQ